MIYVNKRENRILFKIKTGYYLEFLTPKTMKLLGGIKSKINKDKISETMSHLQITEVFLANSNVANKDYYQYLRVLCTFVPNKSFVQLLDILPKHFMFLKTFNSEFLYIEVWFTDQNSKPLEIEDKINITLVIN